MVRRDLRGHAVSGRDELHYTRGIGCGAVHVRERRGADHASRALRSVFDALQAQIDVARASDDPDADSKVEWMRDLLAGVRR